MLPIVVLLILVVLGTALWLASGPYTRTATVPGWVVPDGPAARITPATRGMRVARDVREGQSVRCGDRRGKAEHNSSDERRVWKERVRTRIFWGAASTSEKKQHEKQLE